MIAIVTGGVKGLGKSFTTYLLSMGYDVYAFYNTSLNEAYELEKKYNNLKVIKCDIKNEDEIKDAFSKIDNIDILINNAAINHDNELFLKTKEEFMDTLEVNVVGTFLVSKMAISKMTKGTIINISSNNSLNNFNPISIDYDVSKAGVNLLTKDLALVNENVKVIAICPGWIKTSSVCEMNQEYLLAEMKKSNQKELIDPDNLAKYIIDNIDNFSNGSINEIKEL